MFESFFSSIRLRFSFILPFGFFLGICGDLLFRKESSSDIDGLEWSLFIFDIEDMFSSESILLPDPAPGYSRSKSPWVDYQLVKFFYLFSAPSESSL